jgi:hypothetical protein
MANDLTMCPFCGRRVYLQPPTSGRRALERAVETNACFRGNEVELAPDLRLDDDLDLCL